MGEEERGLRERASRHLLWAKGVLAAGFAGAAVVALSGGHPAAGAALFLGCAAAAVARAIRAREALDRARGHQEMREALEALSEGPGPEEYQGEQRELEEQAGIELLSPGGFLGGRPVYVFAIKEERVYEYQGLASERSWEQDALVINTLLYEPATEDRARLALSLREGAKAG